MKILYIGDLDKGGTCHSRYSALKELEDDLFTLDANETLGWHHLSRIRRFLERYTLKGPTVRSANEELLVLIEKDKPDLIWIDTNFWISEKTLKKIKEKNIILVQYTTDAFFPKNMKLYISRRNMRKTLKYFDFLITTNPHDYDYFISQSDYRNIKFISSKNGYDSVRFSDDKKNDGEKFKNQLVFIGHHEPSTEKMVLSIIKNKLPLTLYGNHHWKNTKAAKLLGNQFNNSLLDLDYEEALRQADIALCFVSQWNYNETAGRTFEITKSGTFLLAQRTNEHTACFREGEEAEFFGSEEELINKIKYYLKETEKRELIAQKGLNRCKISGYSWQDNIIRDWGVIKKKLKQ